MKDTGNVARVYGELLRMAADFVFKPGERLNEVRLSEQLGASRTPLREALNRLVAEGFLTFEPGKGFSCRTLQPEHIQWLYELRGAIECEALRHSLARASEADIANLSAHLDLSEPDYRSCSDPVQLVQMDQTFHVMLAALSGNPEFVRMLKNINDRIRYVRMIDLKAIRHDVSSEQTAPMRLSAHRQIVEALQARDAAGAMSALRAHIERRRDQTIVAVGKAYAQIYVTSD